MKPKRKGETWNHMVTLPQYSIYQHREDKYLWRINLPKSGGFRRRRVRALDLDQALAFAPRAAGLIDPKESIRNLTVISAFGDALSNSKREPGSKGETDWWWQVRRFLNWLVRAHPLCTTWVSLNRQIIRNYMRKTMRNQNGEELADNTIRLYMQPIIQTDVWTSDEYEVPRITRNLKIGSKLAREVGTVYVADILDFLDFLREHRTHIEVPVALTGLVGLSVMEALRLTWSRVDLKHGLIEISGVVKADPRSSEKHRERVIPVCEVVLDVLRRAKARADERDRVAGVISLDGHVVVGEGGNCFVNHDSYRPEYNRARKAWNPDFTCPPKDLRNTILTFADDRGIRTALWEEYTGHAVPGVTKKHYVPRIASRTRGQKEALEEKMAAFRRDVLGPLKDSIREAREKPDSGEESAHGSQ